MNGRKGIYTTEFWITAIVNLVSAVIAVLGVHGMVTAGEGDLYVALAGAIASVVAPVVMGIVTTQYVKSRALVKSNGGG